MRTLIVAAHMDDEALSCGGLIQTRIKQGYDVHVMVPYGRSYSYGKMYGVDQVKERANFSAAKEVLGYKKAYLPGLREGEPYQVGYYVILKHLEKYLKAYPFDEVVIPSDRDLNQDHRFLI